MTFLHLHVFRGFDTTAVVNFIAAYIIVAMNNSNCILFDVLKSLVATSRQAQHRADGAVGSFVGKAHGQKVYDSQSNIHASVSVLKDIHPQHHGLPLECGSCELRA